MNRLWLPVFAFLLTTSLIGCQVAANSADSYSSTDTGNSNGNSNGNGNDNGNGLTLNVTQPLDESVVRASPVSVSGSTAAGAEVMINGLSVSLDGSHFSAMVELEPGPNMIEVIAKSSPGKQATKYITVVYVP
jgi:hypothetical protein